MSAYAAAHGDTPLVAAGRSADGRSRAAWALLLDRAGVLRLLQHAYSDQRTCISQPELGVAELAAGLASAVRAVSPVALCFRNVPPWGATLAAAREGLRQLGWPTCAFSAWPCPLVRVLPGADARVALQREINRHHRVRDYAKRLAKEPG